MEIQEYLDAGLAFEADKSKIKPTVFVSGPFIDPNDLDSADDVQKLVRYFTYNKIKEVFNFEPSIGEHDGLKLAGKLVFKDNENAHHTEMLFVREKINAMIMFPCSVGSFLEFGIFCWYKEICEKSLILVDERYRKSTDSYMFNGPLKLAKQQNAYVEYVDYENHDAVWRIAEKFINKIINDIYVEQEFAL